MKEIFAHGAIYPVRFDKCTDQVTSWARYKLSFGATVCGCPCRYPVAFYTLENIKELHEWIGEQIAAAEAQED